MRRLLAATAGLRARGHARCELCAAPLEAAHDHLYSPAARLVRCACLACAATPASAPRLDDLRLVPRLRRRLDPAGFGAVFDRLGVPVGIAIALRRDDGRIALAYPGPGGLVVAAPADAAALAALAALWELRAGTPPPAPEVEALVWARLDGAEQLWRAGIDVVFRLVGELRAAWRGPGVPAAIAHALEEPA